MEEFLTESINPNTVNIDEKEVEDILRLINEEDKKVPFAVEKEIPKIAKLVEEILKRINMGGRVFYIGAGTSGRLGVLDASEIPPTFGEDPNLFQGIIAGGDKALRFSIEGAEDNYEQGKRDLEERDLRKEDVVIGIAASGRTPYVMGALEYAKNIGAFTASIVCNKNTPLEKISDLTVTLLVGPEVITGSTRMKSGTAQKLVLNMISTAVMIKRGRVYGNLMGDLQIKNRKLKERAIRIIRNACNLSQDEAEKYWEMAKGNTKIAIVMAKTGLDYDTCKLCLEKNKGRIKETLEELERSNS
ncbi:MAG: N-acetylmuramic acid 6-phosphate etherase [Dictyoglomaceae bacterium]|nr:N-acetylmuramic acid 6-phosphate etherase [Dictyoglomaceae bacterium]